MLSLSLSFTLFLFRVKRASDKPTRQTRPAGEIEKNTRETKLVVVDGPPGKTGSGRIISYDVLSLSPAHLLQ